LNGSHLKLKKKEIRKLKVGDYKMRRIKNLLFIYFVFLIGRELYSEELQMEKFFTATDQIVIQSNLEEFSDSCLEFPAVPQKHNMSVVLKFDAYLKSAKPAGWNNYLMVSLNGKGLDENTSSGFNRLLGKENLKCHQGDRGWWKNGKIILLLFTPDKKVFDSRITSSRKGLYSYVIDISDVVNYLEIGADDKIEKNDSNKLEFINTYFRKLGRSQKLESSNLIIDNLQVAYVPSAEIAKARKNEKIVKFSPRAIVASLNSKNYFLDITSSGGIILKIGPDNYYIESAYSYPSKKGLLFNRFSVGETSENSDWTPSISQNNETVEINGRNKFYTVKRQLSHLGAGIKIKDKITNTSGSDIGIYIKTSIATGKSLKQNEYYLSGLPGRREVKNAANNPTIFIQDETSSAGMIVDDSLQRCQLQISKYLNILSFNDSHFGLKAGSSYTLEYTLYPFVKKNYFSFINTIRKERKLNCTIPGPFAFGWGGSQKGEVLICAPAPWFDFCCGGKPVLSRNEYKKKIIALNNSKKARNPGVLVISKLETNSRAIDKRTIVGGEKLPKGNNKKGYCSLLSKEQTAVLDDSKYIKYKDSSMRSPDGRLYVDTYYPHEPYINILLLPEGNNQRFRDMIENIDFMLDEVGLDGVYTDCFEPSGDRARYSYEKWDGHTVDLDSNGNILRKYYDYTFTGANARKRIIEHVLKKGKILVQNGQPATNETNIPGRISFTEMENDNVSIVAFTEDKPPVFLWQARSQLSVSPVVLGLRPRRLTSDKSKHAKILMRGIITALRHGLLYYYYGWNIPLKGKGAGAYGAINHMFPFTPVELNEGFLIGKERIITCVSGKYFWPNSVKPTCFLFNEFGKEKSNNFQVTQKDNGWEIDLKLKDWNEIAVIEHGNLGE
jgi:hypothetical protein